MPHANNPAHNLKNLDHGGQLHTLDRFPPLGDLPLTTAQLVRRVRRRFPALNKLADGDLAAAVAATAVVLGRDNEAVSGLHLAPRRVFP